MKLSRLEHTERNVAAILSFPITNLIHHLWWAVLCYSKRNWYQVNGHTLDQHGKVTTHGTVMVVWACWLVVVVRLLIGCGDCMNVTSIQPKFFGRNRIYRLTPEFHEINDKKVPIPNRQNKICFPVSCFASNLSSVVCDHLFICTRKKGTYNNMHWA